MRRLAAGGGALALSVLLASGVSAQTRLDRPLWLHLEPETTSEIRASEPLLQLTKSYGPSGAANGSAPAAEGELTDSEYGSLGCLIGGTVGTAAAIAIGGTNIVNLIAGGIVPAATPGALYAAMAGVVFASFCAVGQAATPALLLAYRSAWAVFAPEAPESAPAAPREDRPPPLLGRLIKAGFEPQAER